MCKWGDTVAIEVSKDGKTTRVDKCIVSIVVALNRGGVKTTASCCGHGKGPGCIILEDGRELVIAKDFETARFLERAGEEKYG